MPARRLPWFKLWPEAMRHEKVVLLSDGAFRTWVVILAAGSEQAVRWRFASITHLVRVTGRQEAEVRELIGARLLDLSRNGEVWVHDWRQWQERYESDVSSANAPPTLRNETANAPRRLPGEERGERREGEGEGDTSSPLPPPPQAEEGAEPANVNSEKPKRRKRRGAVPEDPNEYTTGTYGRMAAEMMARKLGGAEGSDG